jgi:hypothetical protein
MSGLSLAVGSLQVLTSKLPLAAGLSLQPETWPQPVRLILVCFAAGFGAFIVARFMVSFGKALVVGVVALICGGGAAYVIFQPPWPSAPTKTSKQEPTSAHAAARSPAEHPSSAAKAAGVAPKPAPAAKKEVRIDWDEAKKHLLVNKEAVPVSALAEKLKKLRSEQGPFGVVLSERLCSSPERFKEVEKVCKDLDVPSKKESAAKSK